MRLPSPPYRSRQWIVTKTGACFIASGGTIVNWASFKRRHPHPTLDTDGGEIRLKAAL